jgi:hypothetical protein
MWSFAGEGIVLPSAILREEGTQDGRGTAQGGAARATGAVRAPETMSILAEAAVVVFSVVGGVGHKGA